MLCPSRAGASRLLRRIGARGPALLGRAAREAAYRPIPWSTSLTVHHSSISKASIIHPKTPPCRPVLLLQRVEEEQPQVTGNSRRQPRPTPSPTRPTSINTCSRTQCHHAPARSPGRQTTPNISDWTVASLQKALRDKGIPFHRTDNKAKLLKILKTARCTSSSDSDESSSGDVIAQRHGIATPVGGRGTAGSHQNRTTRISAAKMGPAGAAGPRRRPRGPSTSSQVADRDSHHGGRHRGSQATCCLPAAVPAADRSGVRHWDASASCCLKGVTLGLPLGGLNSQHIYLFIYLFIYVFII